MTTNDPIDRRRAPRIDTSFDGTLNKGGDTLGCRITNVSRIGTCAVSPTPLNEMALVKVQFRLDDEENRLVTCEAAVVRCQRRPDGQYDLGLFFTMVSAEDRAALDRLVARGAPVGGTTG